MRNKGGVFCDSDGFNGWLERVGTVLSPVLKIEAVAGGMS